MDYMVQKMSYEDREPVTYYRKQRNPHPSADEKRAFTVAAKKAYAAAEGISVDQVVWGDLRTGRPTRPTGGNTEEI